MEHLDFLVSHTLGETGFLYTGLGASSVWGAMAEAINDPLAMAVIIAQRQIIRGITRTGGRLHGGSDEQLPERLWQGVMDPAWKIDGLGISSLGEIVGWALPDRFPPRNGRTSKALISLGYDVTLHV